MPLYTRAKFAELCGCTTGNLTNYIKRGKVVLSGDYVDDDYPLNRDFLEHRRGKTLAKSNKKDTVKPKIKAPVPPDPDPIGNIIPPDDDDDDLQEGDQSTGTLIKAKLKAEILKKHREIALLKLREDKLNGEIIPIDVIKDLFAQHNKSIAVQVKNTIENIITMFAKTANLNVNQIAELRGRALQEINTGVDKAIYETRKSLKKIRDMHSQKKEIGERER